MLIDIAALSALVFFSGGATNPLVSLLLPPVAIAALTLPPRCVAAIGVATVAAYSALMVFHIPLPLSDASRATRLHLLGMWLTFAVSALMIAWFVERMTRLIRQRDAELAAAREQALRDERIMAIGTLAAGAAHELGTPLATMALLAGELVRDPQLPPAAREDIALLRQQIAACKEIITGLSLRAGAERLENPGRLPVDRWLDGVRQRWHALRPQAQSRLLAAERQPAPTIIADPPPRAGAHQPAQQRRQRLGTADRHPPRLGGRRGRHLDPRPRTGSPGQRPQPWRPGRIPGPRAGQRHRTAADALGA